jgi:hypothetical protein
MSIMKNIKIIIVTLLTVVFSISSCDFGDINIDPTSTNKVALKDLLPAAIGQTIFNMGATPGRAAGIVMQYFKGVDAQQLDYQRYIFDATAFNNLWGFGLYGAGAMKHCYVMMNQATEEEAPHYVGIGKILMAANLGMAATMWGDVPFTQAFLGEEGGDALKAVYDTQESVYHSIQQLLDEGIAKMGETPGFAPPGVDDLIYGGDASLWIKTAYALKARYYMHLTKRDNSAASKALGVLDEAYDSNSEESAFIFDTSPTAANPYAQFGVQRPNTLAIAEPFNEAMNSKSDPRLPLYMSSDGTNWNFFAGENALFWSSNNSPLPLISYTEQKFLEAEAQLWEGNPGAAETLLAEAITANMDQLGVAAADYAGYVAANGSFAGLTTNEERLERIVVEKYYAMYCQGFIESWTDYKRTGYPDLTPNPQGVNGFNPSGVIPRRYQYVTDERFSNTVNVEEATTRQGGDLLDVDTWAFE